MLSGTRLNRACFRGGLTCRTAILARSRVGALDRYGYKSYGLWDIYLARSTGRIHPFIQLTNLTNTSYQEVQMVAMPGRAVVLGVEAVLFSRQK